MSNLDAFLTTIAVSEGTQDIPGGDRGYKVIVGSTMKKPILMENYDDHPRKVIELKPGLRSTAAGRYQILSRYFDRYKQTLNLPDFSPKSQDAIAIEMIRECRALDYVLMGFFDIAADLVKSRWASFPGANYGQHENQLADLRRVFIKSGGVVA